MWGKRLEHAAAGSVNLFRDQEGSRRGGDEEEDRDAKMRQEDSESDSSAGAPGSRHPRGSRWWRERVRVPWRGSRGPERGGRAAGLRR